MWFWRKKKEPPTAHEVIEAIFSIFTEEELQSMMYERMSTGEPDPGLKQLFLKCADSLKPKYSVEKSVEIAKEIVEMCRDDLLYHRPFLFREFTQKLFGN